ncbi:thioesterase II family protein [Collimonas pratensis]|uniref:Alpha/beta hydrolase family protein n=1 Tax=Collimonas pratensis TaxID=279113 RepID=A0A127QBY3_9BURK|nr:alpha/beta fold hydrolase [Collimonas pratensis]AMP07568.1 alpha/beta hydrolase family protein [Collimonas pratensis]
MDYSPSIWFSNFSKNIGAPYRLFTFPFAGGGSAIYRQWPARLPGVEVMAVCLPGREMRIEEAPFDSMAALMQKLLQEIAPLLDRPFAFFGHSMGALMAFELARQLAKMNLPQPEQLFLSAFQAPENLAERHILHKLSDADFLRQLIRYGGIPAAVLDAPELLKMILPAMRADFSMIETFGFNAGKPIASDIVAFCGSHDHAALRQDMLGWRDQTSAGFSLSELPGGHFFLKSAESDLLQLIEASLEQRQFRAVPMPVSCPTSQWRHDGV